MSPAGRRLDQQVAQQLSQEPHLIIISGHYEAVNHPVIEHLVDLEISIGDYVLTNGAIAAAVLVDSMERCCREHLADEYWLRTTASVMVCWRRRSTLGRPTSVVGKFRRFCSPEITQKSRSGVKSRQLNGLVRIGRIC